MKKFIVATLLAMTISANGTPKNDNFGIEINPTIPIAWGYIYSMGISYFDHKRGTEYALAMFTSLMPGMGSDDEWQSIHMDLQYKKYLSSKVGNGIYIGGFGRYSNLQGHLKNSTKNATENKLGIGMSIGYRKFGIFGFKKLYWGLGLNLGAYIIGDYDIFKNEFLLFGDSLYITDIEFFKFGISF